MGIGIFLVEMFLFMMIANAYTTSNVVSNLHYKYATGDVLTYSCYASQNVSTLNGAYGIQQDKPDAQSYNQYIAEQFMGFDYANENQTNIEVEYYDAGSILPQDTNPLTNTYYEWSVNRNEGFNVSKSVNSLLLSQPTCLLPEDMYINDMINVNLLSELKILTPWVQDYVDMVYENITTLNADTITTSGNIGYNTINFTMIETIDADFSTDRLTLDGETPMESNYSIVGTLEITIQGSLSSGHSWKDLFVVGSISAEVVNSTDDLIVGIEAVGSSRLTLIYDSTGMGYINGVDPIQPSEDVSIPSWIWYVIGALVLTIPLTLVLTLRQTNCPPEAGKVDHSYCPSLKEKQLMK